ncbi:MAG: succinate dehydrogenase assembly factor 2 [Pseudomonadota bacterium]|nr:succinate dehydrogenase assembly factor 2 [Pseudomonadota bacterium]
MLIDQRTLNPEPTLAELRWRSRRGTRELDLILLGFLSAGFEDLTPQDRRVYARLLDTPDPDLMTWLLGQASPSDPEIAKLVQAIRAQSFSTEADRPVPVRT